MRNPDTESAVNLMVPVNFNLPNMGKLLSLSFVLFTIPISVVIVPLFGVGAPATPTAGAAAALSRITSYNVCYTKLLRDRQHA